MTEDSNNKKRVFLLDDHEIVRRGVADLLESTDLLKVVGEAGTVEEARNRIPLCNPDVAVLDLALPDGDGISLCRELKVTYPSLNCLILTSFADDDALLAAVMAGAMGFVAKQIKGSDLAGSVITVANGVSLLKEADISRARERVKTPSKDPLLDRLTEQEQRVLFLLAEGLTNRQIGETLFLAEKTVKNYVSSLLAKMGFARRTEAAVWASKHQGPSDQSP